MRSKIKEGHVKIQWLFNNGWRFAEHTSFKHFAQAKP